METLALIPARGGSTGLPGKNIRNMLGKPLISHTIKHALNSRHISRTIVSTDSEEIAEVGEKYGAEVPFMRPKEISQVDTHFFAVIKHAVEWLDKNEKYRPDIVCCLMCTTPLRNAEDIDECIKLMIETSCDWCFTVNEIEHHPWRAMVVKENVMKPLFDVPRHQLWANRQELPSLYRMNGGVIAGRIRHILEHDEYNIDNLEYSSTDVRCVILPQKRSLDIDTIDDFNFVEATMRSIAEGQKR